MADKLLNRLISILVGYWREFLALEGPERVFVVLIVVIILFTIASFGFAAYAFSVHVRRQKNEKKHSQLSTLWQVHLFEILSEEADHATLHKLVNPEDSLFFLDFLEQYSRRVRGSEQQVIRALAKPYLPLLVKRSRTAEPERRARALKTISELGFSDYPDIVRAGLDDEESLVAMVAARTLLQEGDVYDLRRVIAQMERFTTWSRNYLTSLFTQAGTKGIEPLRELLADRNRRPEARAVAAHALTDLKDLQSLPIATAILSEPLNRDLHVAALGIIESLGDSLQAAEVRRLTQSEDEIVMAHALSTMGIVGQEEDAVVLRASVRHTSPWVARHAAEGLLQLGKEDVLQLIANGEDGPQAAVLAKQILEER